MLVVETIARIRRDHLVKGVPIKKLARDLRVSKNTIRKVVRGDATSHTYERKIQPLPKLGPWVDELERQLEANEKRPRRDRLSLLRIHEDLAAQGYEGGYDAVRRYARGLASAAPSVVAVAGLCAAELRPRRGLPVRLEPRVRASGGCDDPGEGCAHAGSATAGCSWSRSSRARARRWSLRRTSAPSASSVGSAGVASTTT